MLKTTHNKAIREVWLSNLSDILQKTNLRNVHDHH